MLKKTINYVDYDGNQRTDSYWFNLDEAEILEMEMQYPGGAEAVADYNAIKADVEHKFAVTEEYINAVIALRDAADEDAMLAALAVALEKAVDGSDVSVNVVVGDVTVAQANVILSTIDKEVSNSGIRNTKYVAAVNAIAGIENVRYP